MKAFLRGLAFCLASVLAVPAAAQTARVTAGEHAGFTRLVIMAPAIDGWQFGRTAEGYGLRLGPVPRFDLTAVFRQIGRNRLSAAWADPQDGLLHLRIPCDCHAMVFAGGPGVLVVDLKDGPAPADSGFESALVAGKLPALRDVPPTRPRARPVTLAILGPRWAKAVQSASRIMTVDEVNVSGPAPGIENGTLVSALTAELARGAARGLVDFAPPARRGRKPAPTEELPAGLASRLGGMSGMAILVPADEPRDLTSDGADCISDDRVAIGSWGDDRPVWQQLAEATALPAEFDRPVPDHRHKAVRLLLYLGFGLEAARLVEAMPLDPEETGDDPIYLAVAAILDGGEPETGAFAGQGSCDGDVALWSLLAEPGTGPAALNAQAVRRAFSALPLHLRRLLGPSLVRKFLLREDPASSEVIQAAMERVGGALPSEVAASASELALLTDRPTAALEAVASLPATGPGSIQVLVADVEARVRLGQAVPAEKADALAALLAENRGSPDEGDLRRALILAQAGSGAFGSALAAVSDLPDAAEPVWAMLARADDDTLVLHAVDASDAGHAALSHETRRKIAIRLIELGLGPAAQGWLGEPPIDVTLAAHAALLSGDARGALRLLSGDEGEAASALRHAALAQLAAPGYSLPQEPSDPRLAAWVGDWKRVAQGADTPWKALAAEVIDAEAPPPGLIAQGRAVLDRAAATTKAIASLRAAAN